MSCSIRSPLKVISCLLIVFLCAFATNVVAQSQPALPASIDSALTGYWETKDKDGIIEIYACEQGHLCGRFYWLKDDSAAHPSRDDRNPDPEKRTRPLCGLTFMGGFTDEGDGKAVGGWIYSIRHGATFSAELSLIDRNTLELRGYMFMSWLGGSVIWTRAPDGSPACALLPSHE